MNDKITISLLQLFEMFPDQESARLYLERNAAKDTKPTFFRNKTYTTYPD